MSEMPSIEQVMSLPKRAIVAYLARCARRLRPTMDRSEKRPDPMPGGWMELFEARNREAAAGVKWESVTAMLDRAIEYAEAVAGGGNAKKADRRFNASVRRAPRATWPTRFGQCLPAGRQRGLRGQVCSRVRLQRLRRKDWLPFWTGGRGESRLDVPVRRSDQT